MSFFLALVASASAGFVVITHGVPQAIFAFIATMTALMCVHQIVQEK